MHNTLYFCDPNKNTACSKTGCIINGGPCYATTKKENAIIDENGNIKVCFLNRRKN